MTQVVVFFNSEFFRMPEQFVWGSRMVFPEKVIRLLSEVLLPAVSPCTVGSLGADLLNTRKKTWMHD